jgi:hypothetical protein
MNNDTKGGRCRPRRAAALAVAVAGLALLETACGGPAAGGPGSSQSPYQQALAYAQCVRSHGEPDFPDPTSQGAFPHIPAGPQYQSANKACGHLLPSQSVTAAQKQESLSRALTYSACMRSHGISDFPDPVVAQGGNTLGLHVNGIDQSSPQFQSAQQACRKVDPWLGPGAS